METLCFLTAFVIFPTCGVPEGILDFLTKAVVPASQSLSGKMQGERKHGDHWSLHWVSDCRSPTEWRSKCRTWWCPAYWQTLSLSFQQHVVWDSQESTEGGQRAFWAWRTPIRLTSGCSEYWCVARKRERIEQKMKLSHCWVLENIQESFSCKFWHFSVDLCTFWDFLK